MIGALGRAAAVSRRSRPGWAVLLGFSCLVGASYFPALMADYVWDDYIFTLEPDLTGVSGLVNVWFSPSALDHEGHYWPVTYTTFWLEHMLGGPHALFSHLVNVLLHLANSVLLLRLLRRLDVPGSVFVAAVFAVHPIHVESVAWVIERKDVLSGLLYLSAALAWLRFAAAPKARFYCLCLILYTAAVLSKSVAVTLPAALLLQRWWKHGRIRLADLGASTPFFAAGLLIGLGDLRFYQSREVLSLDYSLLERMLIAGRALWFYAVKLLWPVDLAPVYPHWDTSPADPLNWVCLSSAVAVAGLLWFFRDRIGRGASAGVLFFAVTLSPVLGFIDYGYMQFSFVADRFQYLAGIGVLAVAVCAAREAARAAKGLPLLAGRAPAGASPTQRRWMPTRHTPGACATPSGPRGGGQRPVPVSQGTAPRRAGIAAASAVLLLLGALTWRYAEKWSDEITLYSFMIEQNHEARQARSNLAIALYNAGRYEEGIAQSMIAIGRYPEDASLRVHLASALIHLGDTEEAEKHLLASIEQDPGNEVAHYELGRLLRDGERFEEAVESYRAALAVEPEFALARAAMGASLTSLGRGDEGTGEIERALSLVRDDRGAAVELLLMVATAYFEAEDFENAEMRFEQALEKAPDNADALLGYSLLLSVQQRHDEADAYLRRSQEQNPEPADVDGLFTLGELLRSMERHEEAVESYRAAVEISPRYAQAYAGLGNSLFYSGRRADAITAMKRGLELGVDSASQLSLHLLIVDAAHELGRSDEVEQHLELALEVDPLAPAALERLAHIRYQQARHEEALSLLERLVGIQPENSGAHSNLGVVLLALGRYEEALASIDTALSLSPGDRIASDNRELALSGLQGGK